MWPTFDTYNTIRPKHGMERKLDSWYSPSLGRQMEIASYGHYGFALLLFPSAAADYLEYERFYLIDSIAPHVDSGKVRVFSINSINSESWLNHHLTGREKAVRHQQYNRYVADEVVPYISNAMGGGRPTIVTCGVSLGAFHAANTLFRRPDLFDGVIGMSGIYDLKSYSAGYYDDDVYSNSPVDYLPGLGGQALDLLRGKQHIHFLTGEGPYEAPAETWRIADVLGAKGIPNWVESWGPEYGHDWPTWREMLPSYLDRKF